MTRPLTFSERAGCFLAWPVLSAVIVVLLVGYWFCIPFIPLEVEE